MTDDPLEDIFVKKEEVAGENKVLLGKMIRPFANVVPENGEVIFSSDGDELIAKHKILVFLLCRLALVTRPDFGLQAHGLPQGDRGGDKNSRRDRAPQAKRANR